MTMPHTDEEERYAELQNLSAYKRYRLYQTLGIALAVLVMIVAVVSCVMSAQ